jgi:dTDP-4-dehydrorhamnose reductase
MLARAVLRALERGGHECLPLAHADADVTRPDALDHALATFKADWIFHLAGLVKVDDCETNADEAFRVNGFGCRNVALASVRHNVRLLSISSDYVFDGNSRRPYREYDPPGPLSVYGASKWAGEQAIRELQPRHTIVRTSWLYGRGGVNFVDTILAKARAGETLRVVDDQHGSPTWTSDLAPALIALAVQDAAGTFHVTNSGGCTWHDLAVRACGGARIDVAIDRISSADLARPAPRPVNSVLDGRLFREVTGMAMPSWDDALDRYLASLEAREAEPVAREARR